MTLNRQLKNYTCLVMSLISGLNIKTVVPRGYVRLLGKLAEFTDAGIPIHYFTGNHDMWTFDYLTKELNVKIYRAPIEAV